MSLGAIARRLGISKPTAWQHLHYAKAKAVKRQLVQAAAAPALAG